jgi:predicted adenine nucleotide alpha hydrolase (AANH) superfamily ATPase
MLSKFFRSSAKHTIKAVHDYDLENYLKSIGFLNKIKEGEVRCKFCGNIITLETIEAIVPLDGEITFVCENQKCINQL